LPEMKTPCQWELAETVQTQTIWKSHWTQWTLTIWNFVSWLESLKRRVLQNTTTYTMICWQTSLQPTQGCTLHYF